MAREKRVPKPPAPAPGWLVTYGDMVTLILSFFVLIVAFSTVDTGRFQAIAAVLSGGSGVLNPGAYLSDAVIEINIETDGIGYPGDAAFPPEVFVPDDYKGEEDGISDVDIESIRSFRALAAALKEYIEDRELTDIINMAANDDDIKFTFASAALFDSGRADLRPDIFPVLSDMIDMINQHAENVQKLLIEGYTDNLPISTPQFPNNSVLSVMRSCNVWGYFTQNGINENIIIAAMGYADQQPVADNDTEEGRAQNRRVEVTITRMPSDAKNGVRNTVNTGRETGSGRQ